MKIGIVFGGTSEEHEVSLAGARSVLKAFKSIEEHEAMPIGMGKDGKWHVGKGALEYLVANADPEKLFIEDQEDIETGKPVDHHKNPPFDYIQQCDYILPVCHGQIVEDGCLQGFFKTMGVEIIGCGVLASAVCFDKDFLKKYLAGHGYNVAPGIKLDLRKNKVDEEFYDKLCTSLDTEKLVIKPNDNGSSIGLSQSSDYKEFQKALEIAAEVTNHVVIEKFIEHREIVVGVIGNGEDIIISDLGESNVTDEKVYYYDEKYHAGSVCKIPANLNPELESKIRQYTADIYQLVECSGWARIDFFVELETDKIYMNEINTIPGMSEPSVFPQIFKSKGYDYPKLIKTILDYELSSKSTEKQASAA